MNKILLENKVKVLERLVLQDIVECYSQQRYSEKSYDDLMAKLLDRMTGFYEELELDSVSLRRLNQYGDRANIYTEKLREDLDKATEVTVRQIVKQLPREKLSGRTQWDVIQAVRPVLRRRMELLGNLLSASALQMKNYMLLWDYQDAGFTHYRLLTEGENCDDCNNLEGQVFPISEARVGENFAPMHPNCNCRVGILDGAGQVAYIISEGKAEKKENETNWYDAFLRMPQDAKELFLAFVRAQNERLGRGNLAGFLDWLTMGIVSGTWQGYQDRYQELLNDPTLYNFVNYLTSGFADTVKGAITPEEPLSLQHWLDSLGVATTVFGAYQMGNNIKSNMPTDPTSYADDLVVGAGQQLDDAARTATKIGLTKDKNLPDFYVGANQKALPSQYEKWIGRNRQQELLSRARNLQLQNAIKQLYRKSSFIGDGGTADVIRFEKETGLMLGRSGNSHVTKGIEMAKYIETKILTQNLISSDRTLAIQLLEDLNNALGR